MIVEIIKFQDSLTEEVVSIWRPSKELAYGRQDIHSFEEDLDFIKNVMSIENDIYLAIEPTTKKVIGMIAITRESVDQLYIHPDFLNKGIGTKLLNLAKEKSTDKLELFVFQINKKAQSFYKKHGFKEIGRNFKNELNLPDIKYQWLKIDQYSHD